MKTFVDTATGQFWQFDDDVIVTQEAGAYVFTAAHGEKLNVPTTLVPGEMPASPAPTLEQIETQKLYLVQNHMDAAAQALRYDDIKTACTYADEPSVPKFQAEGQAFRAWRSLVWAKCYEILEAVHAGERGIPSDTELIAELPELQLPAA